MALVSLPVFPLKTVLFPGSKLRLQIFEQRYLDMVRTCMRQEQGFVVALISEGKEAGVPAEFHPMGTYAEIIDWGQLDNGLLTITIEGRQRARVPEAEVQSSGLLLGQVELIDDEPASVPLGYQPSLMELLDVLQAHPTVQAMQLKVDTEDLNSLLWSLASILPFSDQDKQDLLELDHPRQRLDLFHLQLDALEKMT